jgi:hypothetical protein
MVKGVPSPIKYVHFYELLRLPDDGRISQSKNFVVNIMNICHYDTRNL